MKKIALLIMLISLIKGQVGLCEELTILTEDLPPLNYVENGILVGPSVEIVREIQQKLGSNEPIQVYPWSRAYQMAEEDENVVLFGMTYTEVRKDKFKWVGPLAIKRDILVARKDSDIIIKSIDDAKKVRRIGILLDDTRGRLLASHGFTNLEPVSDEKLNAKKLELGRLDLWAYKIPGLQTVCDLAGVDHTLFKEVYHLREIELMIAFSKGTSDSIVDKWQMAFDELSKDGTILSIQRRWNRKLEDDPFPDIID
jgi:polar amino acid transport system substrate-binding protein